MNAGVPVRWFAEVESTNDIAREWALAGAPAGALVVAARQTRGRGRRERRWLSPAGGLYASFVLRPDWPASEAPSLSMVGALAVYRALGDAGMKELRIKWPNDVLCRGRKISGVLIEPRIGGERIEFAVMGIGVNVARLPTDTPEELLAASTSCADEGVDICVDELQQLLVASLRELLVESLAAIRAAWVAAGGQDARPEL